MTSIRKNIKKQIDKSKEKTLGFSPLGTKSQSRPSNFLSHEVKKSLKIVSQNVKVSDLQKEQQTLKSKKGIKVGDCCNPSSQLSNVSSMSLRQSSFVRVYILDTVSQLDQITSELQINGLDASPMVTNFAQRVMTIGQMVSYPFSVMTIDETDLDSIRAAWITVLSNLSSVWDDISDKILIPMDHFDLLTEGKYTMNMKNQYSVPWNVTDIDTMASTNLNLASHISAFVNNWPNVEAVFAFITFADIINDLDSAKSYLDAQKLHVKTALKTVAMTSLNIFDQVNPNRKISLSGNFKPKTDVQIPLERQQYAENGTLNEATAVNILGQDVSINGNQWPASQQTIGLSALPHPLSYVPSDHLNSQDLSAYFGCVEPHIPNPKDGIQYRLKMTIDISTFVTGNGSVTNYTGGPFECTVIYFRTRYNDSDIFEYNEALEYETYKMEMPNKGTGGEGRSDMCFKSQHDAAWNLELTPNKNLRWRYGVAVCLRSDFGLVLSTGEFRWRYSFEPYWKVEYGTVWPITELQYIDLNDQVANVSSVDAKFTDYHGKLRPDDTRIDPLKSLINYWNDGNAALSPIFKRMWDLLMQWLDLDPAFDISIILERVFGAAVDTSDIGDLGTHLMYNGPFSGMSPDKVKSAHLEIKTILRKMDTIMRTSEKLVEVASELLL